MWQNEHPFPNRSNLQLEDLMYLSTITEKDLSSKKKVFIRPCDSNLQTSDIEGSRPSLKGYEYFNKPSYSNTTDEIEKSSPKNLHQKLNKPNYNLSTKDIEKAYPSKSGFQSKRVGTNPLDPVYQLPRYEVRPFTPPKFIRDHINIHDIEGTKPEIYYKWETRNSMDVADIKGAQPRPEKNLKKPDLMDPRDINKGESHSYVRNTNPLMPEYVAYDEEGKIIKIGHVQGSNPRKAVNTSTSPHNRHLDNRDIEGSTAGTLGLGVLGKRERNYEKKIVNAEDIDGARSGSLKKGINTIRCTNPLDPKYVWKTEDTPPPEKEKIENNEKIDLKYAKSLAKFWGTTPPESETKSPLPASKSSSRQSDFKRNANRFFHPQTPTEETKNKDFSKNAEKFFENKNQFVPHMGSFNTLNKGSIHKAKPKSNFIDMESAEYVRNAKRFYTISQSSNRSIDSKNAEIDPAFNHDARKFYGNQTPPDTGSQFKQNKQAFYEPGSGAYKFQLARSEVLKPGKPPLNPTEPDFKDNRNKFYGATPQIGNNDRNLLAKAAKNFFT